MSIYRHEKELALIEEGYKEALLDVYLFFTSDPQALSIDHFDIVKALATQIAGKLREKELVSA